MALAALISATKQLEDGGDGLRATLPLAGRCLVEHQARLAARAGARHVVILVERLPAALMAAIDRLKRDGLGVEIARTVLDAADRVHPDEALLVFGDGFVTGSALIDRFATAHGPAILTLPDEADTAAFERIDAADRWAGLLLVDGARLRRTAGMLGEWDLESTLLRATVQEGASRVRPDPADHITLAATRGALDGVEDALVAASRQPATDWPSAFLYPAIERLALPPLLGRGTDPLYVAWGSAGLALLGALAVLLGSPAGGLGLLVIAGPVAALARRLAAARLTSVATERSSHKVRIVAAILALLFLSKQLADGQGWGVWVLAALLLLAMAALGGARGVVRRLPGGPAPLWIASLDGLLWTALPFGLAGRWTSGLIALAFYAVASFFVLQRETSSRLPRVDVEQA